jgi:hypothetical protein
MNLIFLLVIAVFGTSSSMAATAVFKDGAFIGINKIHLEGYGLFDVNFYDSYNDVSIYNRDFVGVATRALHREFIIGGAFYLEDIDTIPPLTFGCSYGFQCSMTTLMPNLPGYTGLSHGLLVNSHGGRVSGNYFNFRTKTSAYFDIFADRYTFLEWTDSNISTAPVPAAAFMFAPALLGLFGLRRKL